MERFIVIFSEKIWTNPEIFIPQPPVFWISPDFFQGKYNEPLPNPIDKVGYDQGWKGLAVSQPPVVRSEHVRTIFDSTQSQESKSVSKPIILLSNVH